LRLPPRFWGEAIIKDKEKDKDMIDKVILNHPSGADIKDRIENVIQKDTSTFSGKIGNMKIRQNIGGVWIEGSIAKYLQGENITALTRKDGVKPAIEKLEADTGLDLRQAVVCGLECGGSIILKEKPHEYLRLFGMASRMKRKVVDTQGGIETADYYTETGAYKFTAYDKLKEARKRKMPIPPLFENRNVLRLEYKITKRKGIVSTFGKDLNAHDLYDHDIYRRLQALFYEAYKRIGKTGRIIFADTSKQITPAKLEALQAEKYRQSCPKEHAAYIQGLRESGALSDKNAERIRAADRKAGKDYGTSDKNPLILELDSYVQDMAFYSA
jgi:hypothetical protein